MRAGRRAFTWLVSLLHTARAARPRGHGSSLVGSHRPSSPTLGSAPKTQTPRLRASFKRCLQSEKSGPCPPVQNLSPSLTPATAARRRLGSGRAPRPVPQPAPPRPRAVTPCACPGSRGARGSIPRGAETPPPFPHGPSPRPVAPSRTPPRPRRAPAARGRPARPGSARASPERSRAGRGGHSGPPRRKEAAGRGLAPGAARARPRGTARTCRPALAAGPGPRTCRRSRTAPAPPPGRAGPRFWRGRRGMARR